jgi:hypothetical protein
MESPEKKERTKHHIRNYMNNLQSYARNGKIEKTLKVIKETTKDLA